MNIVEGVQQTTTGLDVTRVGAKSVIKNFIDGVLAVLKADGKVRVPGLGTFRIKDIPAKKARRGPDPFNPGTVKDFAAKPASKRLKFAAAKDMKEAVAKIKVKK